MNYYFKRYFTRYHSVNHQTLLNSDPIDSLKLYLSFGHKTIQRVCVCMISLNISQYVAPSEKCTKFFKMYPLCWTAVCPQSWSKEPLFPLISYRGPVEVSPCSHLVFSILKLSWQVCTSAPLLHHSAPHRFGLQSLNFVLLSSACHAILSSSRKMGDDRKKRSRSRSRDKKRKDRWLFFGNHCDSAAFLCQWIFCWSLWGLTPELPFLL